MQTLTVQSSASVGIAFPLQEKLNAQVAIAAYLALLQAMPETRRAIAGNGSAVVQVPDRLSHVYARLGGADGNVIEARVISLLDPQDGDALLVRKERPGGAGGWVVLDSVSANPPTIRVCGPECVVSLCAMLLLRGFSVAEVAGGDAVAVQGMYAYVAQRVQTEFGDGSPFDVIGNSRLRVIDLTVCDAPDAIQDMDLGAPMESHMIYARDTWLWVSGFEYDGGVTSPFLQPRYLFRYDLTDPTTPVFDDSVTTDLSDLWVPFENGADTYLVGPQLNTDASYTPLLVVDGATLLTVGSIDIGLIGSSVSPLMCGNICIAPTTDLFATQSITAVDLSDPTSPAYLWTDTDAITPIAVLDATHFYARGLTNTYLYDLTTPGIISKMSLSNPSVFNSASNAAEGILIGTCLYKENPLTGTVSVFDVSVPLAPILGDFANTSPAINEAFTYGEASGDVTDGVLRYCAVGFDADGGTGIWLGIFSNTP